jgi:acyl transferase domain-containing protein
MENVDARQAQYWGLARVIGAEWPTLGCRIIDMDTNDAGHQAADVSLLTDVLMNDTQENQIAIRNGRILAARLARLQLAARENQVDFSAAKDGSYLITGGLGMLGRQAAAWLAHRGAGHVVLVSRRAADDSLREVLDQIESSGCRTHVHQADIGQRGEVERLLNLFGKSLPPLRGVIHAAGVVDDALLSDQSWERFRRVAVPKSHGAWNLHTLTADMPLDFFILYSSAASVLGSPGQSNYATANAFLDGLAWQRRAAGLPALSINWGPWKEGMADSEMIRKRLALQGITPLAAAESHQALEQLVLGNAIQATVLDVDWRRMRMSLAADAPPLLDEIAPAATPSRSGDSALVEKLRQLPETERKKLLTDTVQNELQQVLSMSTPPDPDTPVSDMGLDSLMAVEFSSRLQTLLGDDFAVAPTLLFDYPTVTTLSRHLLELVTALPDDDVEPESTPAVPASAERDDVAIIGMSCRFPGAANVEQFWNNLVNGVDSISEIPPDRWNVDEFYSSTPVSGKMYTRQGGFIDGIADFDAGFINISGQEACRIDPQHRLML